MRVTQGVQYRNFPLPKSKYQRHFSPLDGPVRSLVKVHYIHAQYQRYTTNTKEKYRFEEFMY